jgi:hypothetical protein
VSDVKQWKKVAYLIENGFRFRPIWNADDNKSVPYPATMRDAIKWVKQWKDLPVSRGGPDRPK